MNTGIKAIIGALVAIGGKGTLSEIQAAGVDMTNGDISTNLTNLAKQGRVRKIGMVKVEGQKRPTSKWEIVP